MKRLLLTAALLAAPVANAQWYDERRGRDFHEEVAQLQDEVARLREDGRVREFATDELIVAEGFIDELANDRRRPLDQEDLIEAERLIAAVEAAADGSYAGPHRGARGPVIVERGARDAVIIEDGPVVYRDERRRGPGWSEVREARGDARRAHDMADQEREAALAAQLEAEEERAMNARLRAELGQAQTRVTERGIVLTLGDVLFAVGKSDLKPGAARTLDKLIGAMKRNPETRVTIEGHTDSTGTRTFNIDLSKRRAAAVRGYLTRNGIANARIIARGLGPDYPVATNGTEAGRQQNRRVEVLVQNDDDA